jgi:hypothetical protein
MLTYSSTDRHQSRIPTRVVHAQMTVANEVERILKPPGANVVALRQAKR